MTRTLRWLTICFGLFIAGMLLWQFIDYNNSLNHPLVSQPDQKHYFWYNTSIGKPTAPVSSINGPLVKQLHFIVDNGKPDMNSFTCHVTLKNVGNAKAIGVQINVRPFRGVMLSGGEIAPVDHPERQYVSDDDELGQISQWVSFPDMAPGQTVTQDVTFPRRPEVDPGENPTPEITYTADKPKP